MHLIFSSTRPRVLIICVAVLFLVRVPHAVQAQVAPPPTPDTEEVPVLEYDVAIDVGLSGIENKEGDREQFFATAVIPEFTYGKYNGSLLLRTHFNLKERSFRSEDYDSANDIISIIRHVQYAEKGDQGYYVRFGELEESTLGFGQFINLFHNSISLDNQKRGFEVNYRTEKYLLEGMYSNILDPEVFGLRGAYFPLAENPFSILQSIAVGASLAGDLSDKGTLINAELPGAPFTPEALPDTSSLQTAQGVDDGRLFMGGLDVSLPVFVTNTSTGLTYAEISKIFGYGTGIGLGFKGTWQLPDNMRLEVQLEQRYLGKEYIANYFNTLYEAVRLQDISIPVEDTDTEVQALNTRRNQLTAETKGRLGSYITMGWRWTRAYRLRWSYEHDWNDKDNGWLHVDARVKSPELPVYFRLRFDRLKTEAQEDLASTAGNLNFFRFESAVRVVSFLMLGFGVRNSFEPDFIDGIPVGLKKTRRIEPKFILVIPPQR